MPRLKDPFCAISHWFGLLVSLLFGGYLVLQASSPKAQIVFAIYTLGVSALYLASATYHSVEADGKHEKLMRKFDHSAIYLMICASYLPMALLALPKSSGVPIAIAQVVFAICGIGLTFKLKKVPGIARVIIYLCMGWMAVLTLGDMRAVIPTAGIYWLFGGGIVYTIGAIVYVTDRPHLLPGKFSAHDLWHIFVLAGSVCHYIVNYAYVAKVQSPL